MALLLDKVTDIDYPSNYFLFLKTLGRICSNNLERDMQAIEVIDRDPLKRFVYRGRGPLSFLLGLCSSIGSLLTSQSTLRITISVATGPPESPLPHWPLAQQARFSV